MVNDTISLFVHHNAVSFSIGIRIVTSDPKHHQASFAVLTRKTAAAARLL